MFILYDTIQRLLQLGKLRLVKQMSSSYEGTKFKNYLSGQNLTVVLTARLTTHPVAGCFISHGQILFETILQPPDTSLEAFACGMLLGEPYQFFPLLIHLFVCHTIFSSISLTAATTVFGSSFA